MTGERFLELLDDPDQLSAINYEELRTLALAYPYAHNLRYLLALKARQEDRPELDKLLVTAATYSLNRHALLALFVFPRVVPTPVAQIREEVLELKPVSDVLQTLEMKKNDLAVKDDPPALKMQAAAAVPEQDMPSAPPPVADEDPYASWLASFQPPALAPPATFDLPPETMAEPEAAFEEEDPMPAKATPTTTKSLAQQLAERSVSPNQDLISETLAHLLAKQGQKERAIAMYEKLCLHHPEKSAYFAALIEALKK